MSAASDTMRRACDLMVVNGRVLTMNDRFTVYPHGAVAISGGDIVAVGPERAVRETYDSARLIDAHGAIVHPGFVEAHYHASLHLTRGTISDAPGAVSPSGGAAGAIGLYSAWFNELDGEDEHASALLACTEMVRNGVTCFLDPGTAIDTDAVAAAVEAVGMRASLADPFLWDNVDGLAMAGEVGRAPADTASALKRLGGELRRNSDPRALVRGHVGIYGMGSCTDELTVAAKECADENAVILTSHQNFDIADVAYDDKRFGTNAIAHLARLGILGESTFLAHMNVLRDDEIAALADSGTGIVWHPGNYLFYGIASRTACRVPELVERGVPVALMTDAAKVWSFGEMAWAGYLVARMSGGFLPAESILGFQTVGGARAVGMSDSIGSLEPGKRADLVVRSDQLPEARPGLAPVRELMLVSRSKSIDTVIVDGEIVVKNGSLTRMDDGLVYERGAAAARRMSDRLGLRAEARWPECE
jgi:5-methylthioadenosine/S-adenosylhomocysteine deaminase